MSQTLQSSSKLVAVVAAVAITFVLHGVMLSGFDQIASESQSAVQVSHVATQTTARLDTASIPTPG